MFPGIQLVASRWLYTYLAPHVARRSLSLAIFEVKDCVKTQSALISVYSEIVG